MTTRSLLTAMHCSHQVDELDEQLVSNYLDCLDGWVLSDGRIAKTFSFYDYYETLAFINAIAFVIHAEDHHPELAVGYNRCLVCFHTHSVNDGSGGLSVNDFICAAKIDALVAQSFE